MLSHLTLMFKYTGPEYRTFPAITPQLFTEYVLQYTGYLLFMHITFNYAIITGHS
jgi:hypothetical protein